MKSPNPCGPPSTGRTASPQNYMEEPISQGLLMRAFSFLGAFRAMEPGIRISIRASDIRSPDFTFEVKLAVKSLWNRFALPIR